MGRLNQIDGKTMEARWMCPPDETNPYQATVAETYEGRTFPYELAFFVPGGTLGCVSVALMMGNTDNFVRGMVTQPFLSIVQLLMLGVFTLMWSCLWRIPRYYLRGKLSAPPHVRFLSGVILSMSCIGVMLLGKNGIIVLPDKLMTITMFTMLIGCAVAAVEFEAYFGTTTKSQSGQSQ